jgi:integrase
MQKMNYNFNIGLIVSIKFHAIALDHTMILMAYRHGLRVSELISLRWQQIDLSSGLMSPSGI